MLFLDQLAEFSSQTQYEKLSPDVVHQAKRCILDLLGCGIGAMALGCNSSMVEYAKAHGGAAEAQRGRAGAHLWMTAVRVSAEMAALSNGTVAHHLELDDGSAIGASVHPGISVIPAAMAVAEAAGASMREMIAATVVGYEVCIRAGLAAAEGVREHAIHGPALIGPLAAAATAARLYKLSTRETAAAMAIAGAFLPVAPFESFVEGAATKDMYGGWPGLVGIMAADLAARGMDGPHRLFEGKRSVGVLLYHGAPVDLGKALDGLGQGYMISKVAFKAFAACRSVQPTVTAILDLAKKHPFAAEDIASIDVVTYPFAVELSDDTTIATPISARLSIPYAVAAAIRTGEVNAAAYLPQALLDVETIKLMSKVSVKTLEDYGRGPFGVRGSIVDIHLKNGEVLSANVSHTRWDKEDPPSDEDLEIKFRELAQPAMPPATLDKLTSALWRLEELESVKQLIELMPSLAA